MYTGVQRGDSSYNGGSSEDIALSDDIDTYANRPPELTRFRTPHALLPHHPPWLLLPLSVFFEIRYAPVVGRARVKYHRRAYNKHRKKLWWVLANKRC